MLGSKGLPNGATSSGAPAYLLGLKSAYWVCCAPRRACWRSPKSLVLVAVPCSASRGRWRERAALSNRQAPPLKAIFQIDASAPDQPARILGYPASIDRSGNRQVVLAIELN